MFTILLNFAKCPPIYILTNNTWEFFPAAEFSGALENYTYVASKRQVIKLFSLVILIPYRTLHKSYNTHWVY